MSKWESAQEALDVIFNDDWKWINNSRCKYISLRIDTRDGHCVIYDRHGKPITMNELKYQYGEDNETR